MPEEFMLQIVANRQTVLKDMKKVKILSYDHTTGWRILEELYNVHSYKWKEGTSFSMPTGPQ